LLANLFLHYAFDMWMTRTYPHIPFERYADDAICHCKSAEEARVALPAERDQGTVELRGAPVPKPGEIKDYSAGARNRE
jgi:hypothetical protein